MAFHTRLPLIAVVLAGLTFVAVIVDAALVLNNQQLEAEVQGRQLFLNQTTQINQVSNALIQSLGAMAVNANDSAARDLLAEFGITINTNAPTEAPKPAK